MDRRTLLSSLAGGLTLVTVGCLDRIDTPSDGIPNTGNTTPDPSESLPIEEFPETRTDEPPYEITPSSYDNPSEWDPKSLGRNMETGGDLELERLSDVRYESRVLTFQPQDHNLEYVATVVTSPSEETEALSGVDGEVDYDESLVVVIESGYGSGSIQHQWKRAEARPDGIHLYGFYTTPRGQTDDYTSRVSAVRVERPDDVADPAARVSLTISPERRVHFDSTEGVVGIDE